MSRKTGQAQAIPSPGTDLPGKGRLRFQYDGVDRLIGASGKSALSPGKWSQYQQTFAYSPSHNLLAKQRTHALSQPSGTAVYPPKTNISLAYEYSGRPHAPSRVGNLDIDYDPSGNPIKRTKVDTGRVETLVWDDDGRLIQVDGAGSHQRNYFDASGLRALRKGQGGETIFASQLFDLKNGERATKHIFAGAIRIASVLSHYQPDENSPPGQGGVPPGQGGVPPGQNKDESTGIGHPALETPGLAYYFHQDHLGSTAVLTDEYGDVHEHLAYFPDGAVWIDRGPKRPTGGYLFSGKPLDPDTGFYDFGQRFYDPETSLWLGVDPAFTDEPGKAVGKPLMLGLYAYAGLNPIKFVDPDGRQYKPGRGLFGQGARERRWFKRALKTAGRRLVDLAKSSRNDEMVKNTADAIRHPIETHKNEADYVIGTVEGLIDWDPDTVGAAAIDAIAAFFGRRLPNLKGKTPRAGPKPKTAPTGEAYFPEGAGAGARLSGRNPPISPRQRLHTNGTPGKSQFKPGVDAESVTRTAWEQGTAVFDRNGTFLGKQMRFERPTGTNLAGYDTHWVFVHWSPKRGIHGVPQTFPK